MSSIPEVSVIAPFFNRERTLRACLDSVLNQTFSDFELILVNDGSTDCSERLIEGCTDRRVRMVALETNQGPSAARNRGVEAARGRWIAFIDSDDVWRPDKLASQLRYHNSNRLKNSASCTGYHIQRGPDISPGHDVIPLAWTSSDDKAMWICDVCAGSTLMLPREMFKKIGPFEPSLRRLEDREWLVRYSQEHPLAIVPEVLVDIAPSRYAVPETVIAASRVITGTVKHGSPDLSLRKRRLLAASLDLEVASACLAAGQRLRGVWYVLSAAFKAPVKTFGFVGQWLNRLASRLHATD